MTYYAQNGEDEFLEGVLPEKGWFVDVGAWNGRHFSNTFIFVEKGWNGLEIEADSNKVLQMKRYLPDRIYRLAKKVQPEGIDELLEMFPDIPKDFDLLSIDIDSFDYWVWKNLNRYSPKFVIIESNSMNGDYVQPPEVNYPRIKGSSPEALRKLAKEKGYKEIFFNGNLIFKRNDI